MEKQVYITEGERAKCKKVAEAFTELYEMADIVVVDVGRYGFVMLKYYMPPHGFEEDETYTVSDLHHGNVHNWLWNYGKPHSQPVEKQIQLSHILRFNAGNFFETV